MYIAKEFNINDYNALSVHKREQEAYITRMQIEQFNVLVELLKCSQGKNDKVTTNKSNASYAKSNTSSPNKKQSKNGNKG